MGLLLLPVLLFAGLLTIPRILRARIAANETSAVASLRQINSAATAYSAAYHNGYPLNLTMLSGAGIQDCDHAGLIDGVLASGFRNGYVFIYQPTGDADAPNASPKAPAEGCTIAGAPGFVVTAEPSRHGNTGDRSFYMDQSGVIRYEQNGVPTADSPPIN
jgi:type IV pilus assembly protein PilA